MKTVILLGHFILALVIANSLHALTTPINIIFLYSIWTISIRKDLKYVIPFMLCSSLIQDTLTVVPLFTFALAWIISIIPTFYIQKFFEEAVKSIQPIWKVLLNSLYFSGGMLSHISLIKLFSGAGKGFQYQDILLTLVLAFIVSYFLQKHKEKAQSIYNL